MVRTVKRIRVSNPDLLFYSLPWRTLFGFSAAILGTIGFTVSWIAVELAFPALFSVPNSLLIVVSIGTYSFALLAMLRNRLLRRMTKRGFPFVLRFQRLFYWLFWAASLLAIYGYLARTGRIPEYSPTLSLLFMGFYFVLTVPWLVLGRLISRLREARLSLLQFMVELDSGRTNYYWLKNGLSGVERQIRKLGYSVPRGGTYRWACFSLEQSIPIVTQLKSLSDWVRRPQRNVGIEQFSTTITVQARAADREGYRPPRVRSDIPGLISSASLPRWWDNVVSMAVVFSIGTVILFVASESNLPPIPQTYALWASLGFLSITLVAVFLVMRRKPPGQTLKLVREIFPTVESTDDSYDEDHFWQLVKLISERQETIQSLGPALRTVAPGIFKGLSGIVSPLEVEGDADTNGTREISRTLFLDPQSRRLVSDLREDCDDLLAKNAYEYPDS